jgi:hypothetical protein
MAEPFALFPYHKPMSLERFHCDTFELRLRFDAGEQNVDAFLKALNEKGVKTEPDEDGDREIGFAVASDDETSDEYHAHITVRIWEDGSGRLDLSYHSGEAEKNIEPPPSVSDCARWLGAFFTDELTTHTHVNYTLDKSFNPTMSLNFPLTSSEKSLAGAVVSGLALILPQDPKTTVIIQSGKNGETYIFLRKTIQLDLKDFSLMSELEQQLTLVETLVKKAT